MFASSSRVAVRSLRAGQVSAFSTSAPVHRLRKGLVVELLADVPGLGLKFDRVKVSAARMRHNLAPFRLARWIPWKQGAEKPVPFLSTGERPAPSEQTLLGKPGGAFEQADTKPVDPTPTEILNKLHLLPDVLTFERRTISPSTPALHGSLTLSDVHERIAELGLTGKEVDVAWTGEDAAARMKELGTWDATVTVRGYGGEQVDVAVEVVRKA